MNNTISDFLKAELLDHVLKVGSYSVPAELYLALSTATTIPGSDTSAITSEVFGSGYSRVLISGVSNAFGTPAASRVIFNDAQIAFPTAYNLWGDIKSWAICDAATAGNHLASGTFPATKVIKIGDTAHVFAGEISISIDGGTSHYLANQLLDHVFARLSFAVPSTLAVAYSTGSIESTLTGETIVEHSGDAYARTTATAWNAATGTSVALSDNSGAITSATATGSGWGTLTDIGLLDGGSTGAGNLLYFSELDSPVAVGGSGNIVFPSGDLDITSE